MSQQKESRQEQGGGKGIFDVFRYKTIKEDDINDLIDELRMELLESDVSYEVTQRILDELKKELIGKKVRRSEDIKELVRDTLKKSLNEQFSKIGTFDLLENIKKSQRPYVIAFFGINGVGKTTTIAKIAYMLKNSGFSVVIAAADTFRAAAQEQLSIHAQKLEVPIVRGKYGGDPASVAYDAISLAKKKMIDVVLIDTAGRMHTDANLVDELRKIIRVAKPNLKILVLDALTGNDALEQARYFESSVGFDAIVITKADADVKGGVILTVSYEFSKPIIFVGVGQEYDKLVKFDPNWYVNNLL
ncbi:MAG: signal recognition particle-docking protein FtsY [Sulfolobaceae archaeon]|nr:signal recognition particle-docking protein FtsY [Sulfolobaceae archaeon]